MSLINLLCFQDAVEEGETITAVIAQPDTNELLMATNPKSKIESTKVDDMTMMLQVCEKISF